MKDNRWTKRCTEWQPKRGKRSRGRPSRRWQDDIEGITCIRKAIDRRQWKALVEGYFLQWTDKALLKLKVKQKYRDFDEAMLQSATVWKGKSAAVTASLT